MGKALARRGSLRGERWIREKFSKAAQLALSGLGHRVPQSRHALRSFCPDADRWRPDAGRRKWHRSSGFFGLWSSQYGGRFKRSDEAHRGPGRVGGEDWNDVASILGFDGPVRTVPRAQVRSDQLGVVLSSCGVASGVLAWGARGDRRGTRTA